ncbi:E3 ubiquitin-protein ligase RNF103 [Manis javanica]|nr:E3 ubiquitin-protein ligase RNF103 [Manis javanica]
MHDLEPLTTEYLAKSSQEELLKDYGAGRPTPPLRFFEAIVWYETGIFATQLVDPVALSFKKLKTILECRGLGYSGLPEKKDVRELVEKSGDLMEGELYSALKEEEASESVSSTNFSGEMHFYELVEDTKDGIWLVQVIANDRSPLVGKIHWEKMVKKVSRFGIRTGTFNCSSDPRYCRKRGWVRSTLIMSVPQTSTSKGKVMLKEYSGRRIEVEHIFKWITAHAASRIKTIYNAEHLKEEWNKSDQFWLPYLDSFYEYSLKLLRYSNTTTLASWDNKLRAE